MSKSENATMMIRKDKITTCQFCNIEHPEVDKKDEDGNVVMNEDGKPERTYDPDWNGVVGYRFDDYSWKSEGICESCMNKLIKGVNLINTNKLIRVDL